MGRLFGTDGARGVANQDLNVQLAMDIAKAAGMILKREKGGKPTFVVGKDTRISGDMLESAMAAGLTAVGADVILLGVVPTPAVAYLVKELGADAGIMLTASHNPFEFNGIKIFNAQGFKLSDADEEEIEAIVLDQAEEIEYAAADEIGRVTDDRYKVSLYVQHIKNTVSGRLSNLKVVLDCSNGSASRTAASIFADMGVQLTILNANPNGVNVNLDCGSMHVERLAQYVKANHFDVGLAFDGDADRCLAVDSEGTVIDGDIMISIFAKQMKDCGTLKGDSMVGTVMSNLGFFRFGEANGITVHATKVGDRYVLEKMLEEGYQIGGEQSGHIIFLEHMTTGDGQLSGLQLLDVISRTGKPLSELKNIMTKYPQVSVNVHAGKEQKEKLPDAKPVWDSIDTYTKELEGNGRILVRPSGTEPLIRVMVEGADIAQINEIANSIAKQIEETL
ncbi:phosphoglucosamine mutase [Hydrogenoanaerobacterium sp.]|uniref:phosphoglucosamine mutase n=1 Tax=Hydrogenoanaerobacterium sp. TaxID=2953763 RepID=UPI0028992A38|nr:phosphoglucosamine mutase [Hydrogenoanaerobacterium sp.]